MLGLSPEELGLSSPESRFGDKQMLIEVMEHGTAEIKGALEDFHNIPPHRNRVEWAYVTHETIATRNSSEFVVIDDEAGHHIECIFKPLQGEDVKFHNENGLGHDYSREVASYLVSEHFGFDLVPPTTLRQINGKVGSLQLFMPEKRYELGVEAIHRMRPEDDENFEQEPDVHRLAVFDWIIANADRHVHNYMMKMDDEGYVDCSEGLQMVAIDNGAAFNELFYRMKASPSRNDLPGPYQFLTRNNVTNKTVKMPLPPELLAQIRAGADRRDQLTESLLSLPDLDPKEVERLWQRVDALIESGVFLSGYNYGEHVEYPKNNLA